MEPSTPNRSPAPTPASTPNGPNDPASTTPRKRRGCLGLAFKSTIGCAAFALGSLVVVVLLLPTLCGSLVASWIEHEFGARFRGSLEVGRVELAWTKPEIVRDVVLRAPDRSEVARVSATLPSLLDFLKSGGSRFGRVSATVNADLVADDAGVTNLERAIEPKATPTPTATKISVTSDSDRSATIAALDLDLDVTSQRLAWSDADTRRVGTPFEVRDLSIRVEARPGRPMTAHAAAAIAADSPGELALDATLNDLLKKGAKWPWGRIDAKLSVKGFSSAMVDGIANQHGRLKELLGPRFDLTLDATDATPESGDVALTLESASAHAHLAGHFADGAFHVASDADAGVAIPLPRAYIDALVSPNLPPGSKLVFESTPSGGGTAPPRWTLHVQKLELPIPEAAARDLASLAPYLERLACDLVIDLPAGIGFESSAMPQGTATPTLRATRFGVHVAPKEPLALGLKAELDMNGKSNVGVEVTLRDPWKALASKSLPHADAHAEITDVGTPALDAILQQGGRLSQALGPKLNVRFKAEDASAESGTFSLEIGAPHLDVAWSGKLEQGRVRSSGGDSLVFRADPPADWIRDMIAPNLPAGTQIDVGEGGIKLDGRELTFVLSGAQTPTPGAPTAPGAPGDAFARLRGAAGQISCDLPAVKISNEKTRAAKLPIEIGATHLALNLAADGKCSIALKSALDTGRKGSLSVSASSDDAWKLAGASSLDALPPIDAKVVLDGVSAAALDAALDTHDLIASALGANVAMTLDARGATMKSGTLRLDVTAPRLKLGFAGRFDNGALRCTGDEGLTLDASPSKSFLAHELGSALPKDARIDWPERALDASGSAVGAKGVVHATLRETVIALPDAKTGAKLDGAAIAALLEKATAKLHAEIERVGYSDARTQAAKISPAIAGLVLDADVEPSKPLAVKLGASVEAGGKGALDVDLSVHDAWSLIASSAKHASSNDAARSPAPDSARSPMIDAKVTLKGLPSASIDALAGTKQLFAELFGAGLDVTAAAEGATLDKGSFHLDVKSPTTSLKSSGRFENGALVCSGEQGLDLSVHFPPGWLEQQISPLLPAGARLSAPSDATPLELKVRDVRVDLLAAASSTPSASTPAPKTVQRGSGADRKTNGPAAARAASHAIEADSARPQGTDETPRAASPSSASSSSSSATQKPGNSATDGSAVAASDAMKATLERVSKLALRANLVVPTLTYADAGTDAAKQPMSIRDFTASIDLSPSKPPAATLHAKLDAATPGDLNASLRALDPLEKLADRSGLDSFRIAIDVEASHVPTALIDALSRQNGLLVGALGARLEMSIKSDSLSREAGKFVASLSSDEHSMHLVEGHFDHGDLVIDKDGGLVAKVGLSPLVSQRVVGNLVPLLVDVQKPEGSQPAEFTVDKLRWPKDGDIGKLDAIVRVNLGEVSYRLIPGLEAVFGSAAPKTVKVPELNVPIQHGVASYAGLPIKIGGRDFTFKGSFNLKDQSFNLGTDVPLGMLGNSVEHELDKLRGVLGPETLVPIEIRGTWNHPHVGIGSDFMKHALEDAAKKELPGLLDGLLKKKKKN